MASPPPLSLLERAAARLPPPRRAQHAVRTGRCAVQPTILCPRTPVCVLPAGVQVGGEGWERHGGFIIAIFGSILGDALHPLFTPAARNRPFDPAAAWRNCLFASSHDLLYRCGCSQGKGRRQRQRARPFVHEIGCETDDDKEDKMKARDGAYQHHLKFTLGSER